MRLGPPPRHPKVSQRTSLRARAAATRGAAAGPPVGAIESLESRLLLSTYYVATSGSDANAGSLDYPFRSIQRAATIRQPSDTRIIRGGPYRETVNPV